MFVRVGKILRLNEFAINSINSIMDSNHISYRICTKCGKFGNVESFAGFDGYNSVCDDCLIYYKGGVSAVLEHGEIVKAMFEDYENHFMENNNE